MALPSFSQRVGYHWMCEIPAEAHSPEAVDDDDPSSLRHDANSEELSYCQVIDSLHDGTYKARVAVSPHVDVVTHGYTVVLSEEQLAYAFPWDCRLQGRSSERVCTILSTHGASLPSAYRKANLPVEPVSVPTGIPPCTARLKLFVSCVTVWRALAQVRHAKLKEVASTGIGRMRFWLQLGWLRAVLDMLARRIGHVCDQSDVSTFLQNLKTVMHHIWVVLHRRRQYLVSAYPAYCAWYSHPATSDPLIPEKMKEGDVGCQPDEHTLCVLPCSTSLVIHPSSTAVIRSHRR